MVIRTVRDKILNDLLENVMVIRLDSLAGIRKKKNLAS